MARYGFELVALLTVSSAELDLRAHERILRGDPQPDLPALRRLGLFALRHLLDAHTPGAQQDRELLRSERLVQRVAQAPLIDVRDVEVDAFRVADATEEEAQVRTTLEDVATALQVTGHDLKQRQVEELDRLGGSERHDCSTIHNIGRFTGIFCIATASGHCSARDDNRPRRRRGDLRLPTRARGARNSSYRGRLSPPSW